MSFAARIQVLLQRLLRNWPAKALAVVASIILYMVVGVDSLEERFISVPVEYRLPDNLVPGRAFPTFVRVYLRGNGQDIFSISEADILVEADFSGFEREGVYQVSLDHLSRGLAESIEPLEVRIEPALVELTLEQRVSLRLPVVPSLVGNPAPGFELSSFSVVPPELEVFGPRSIMDRFTELDTEELDISAQDDDFTLPLQVLSPSPLIGFANTRLVEIRGAINESVLVNNFQNVALAVTGLDTGFQVEFTPETGSIRAQASQTLISQTNPDDISLTIDATDISEPGLYLLPVRPVVPRGFVIFRFDPVEVEVFVREVGP